MSYHLELALLNEQEGHFFKVAHQADCLDFVREFAKQRLVTIRDDIKSLELRGGLGVIKNEEENETDRIV